jgi:myo-inositol-1(or 4)-monophosphatase
MKEVMIQALQVAGRELLNHYGKNTDFRVKESKSSIVTEADLKSDSLIVKLIQINFPSHNILSEESGFRNLNSKYTWVIDPLDGTSNFASSIPWFGVLIALLENGDPVLGGAYLPVSDHLYFAEKGKGTTLNGIPFVMTESRGLQNSLFSFNVDFTDNEMILNESIGIYKNLVKAARNIRCTNSLVDFLYVADGKFGGVINLFTRIWDIAALGLIISEAGGFMRHIDGKEINFRLDDDIAVANFAVMAGSGNILDELKKTVLPGI